MKLLLRIKLLRKIIISKIYENKHLVFMQNKFKQTSHRFVYFGGYKYKSTNKKYYLLIKTLYYEKTIS